MLSTLPPEDRATLESEGRYRAMGAAWNEAMAALGWTTGSKRVVWPQGEAERVLQWRKR